MEVSQAVQECVAAMEAAIEVFKTGAAGSLPSAGANTTVKNIADKLKGDAAKVGVMLGDGASLPPAEVAGLLSTLQQSAVALTLAMHALTYQAGPSLKDDLKNGATSVMDECIALANALAPAKDGQPDLTQAVGRVWNTCDRVKKQALDNKGAVFRRLAAALRACKDVTREMTELKQENDQQQQQAGANGHHISSALEPVEEEPTAAAAAATEPADASGDGEGDDEDEDLSIYDYDSQPLSENERRVLDAGVQLIDLTVNTIQFLGKAIVSAESLSGEAVEGWESCCWHVRTLQRGVEDLGAALNAPQDLDEVSTAAEAIAISLECMLDELPQDGPQVDPQLISTTQVAVEAAKSRLDALLAVNQSQAEE